MAQGGRSKAETRWAFTEADSVSIIDAVTEASSLGGYGSGTERYPRDPRPVERGDVRAF